MFSKTKVTTIDVVEAQKFARMLQASSREALFQTCGADMLVETGIFEIVRVLIWTHATHS